MLVNFSLFLVATLLASTSSAYYDRSRDNFINGQQVRIKFYNNLFLTSCPGCMQPNLDTVVAAVNLNSDLQIWTVTFVSSKDVPTVLLQDKDGRYLSISNTKDMSLDFYPFCLETDKDTKSDDWARASWTYIQDEKNNYRLYAKYPSPKDRQYLFTKRVPKFPFTAACSSISPNTNAYQAVGADSAWFVGLRDQFYVEVIPVSGDSRYGQQPAYQPSAQDSTYQRPEQDSTYQQSEQYSNDQQPEQYSNDQ